jgi:hypothetical protein
MSTNLLKALRGPDGSRRGRARVVVPLFAAAVALGSLGVAQATSTSGGMGQGQFGKTVGFYQGHEVSFTCTHGYFCDTSIPAKSTTGCEAGTGWKKAPSPMHDPLYITVPLGFNVPAMQMDCPNKLVCVDHPDTIDLSRLATVLAPIFGTTPAKLAPVLANYATPGHDHFVTTLNGGKAEWWDVYVVGVTSRAVYDDIHEHGSATYLQKLIAAKNPNVTAPIPTNLFLFFSAL